MKGTVDFYNKTASDWAEKGYGGEADPPCLMDFVNQLDKGSRFLDLCCGAGYNSRHIQNSGYEVVGIDFSEESLLIAREKNPAITFYNDNLLNDYSYIGKVDAIVIIAGLVHIENSDLRTAFLRMHSVLNDNGRIFMTVREGVGKIPERSLTTIDGEEYDRNFIAHTLDELTEASKGLFSFSEEMGVDGTVWHHYVFKRED
jgi:SAM-dependent methyltransferase